MNEKVFLPPTSKRFKDLVKDQALIKEAVNSYVKNDYYSMTNLILEYGELRFFCDLVAYFNAGRWNNINNKHLTFTGIVLNFFSQVECKGIRRVESKMNEEN